MDLHTTCDRHHNILSNLTDLGASVLSTQYCVQILMYTSNALKLNALTTNVHKPHVHLQRASIQANNYYMYF